MPPHDSYCSTIRRSHHTGQPCCLRAPGVLSLRGNAWPEWRNGRRYGLKNRWGRPRTGSIPVSGTILECGISRFSEVPHFAFKCPGWNSGWNSPKYRIFCAPLKELIKGVHVLVVPVVQVAVAISGHRDRAMAHPAREGVDV